MDKIIENSVDLGYLSDWYINSIMDSNWTNEQLEELVNDFYCIPKSVVDVVDKGK